MYGVTSTLSWALRYQHHHFQHIIAGSGAYACNTTDMRVRTCDVLPLLLPQSPHICLTDIAHFINSKGLARVELREEDILTIMETLIADGRCGTH